MQSFKFFAVALCASFQLLCAGVIDRFEDGSLSDYTLSRLNDGNTSTNVVFSEAGGKLLASYMGANSHEQVLLLRSDVGLAVGEVLSVDVNFPASLQGYDFGLALASTASPMALASGASGDVRAAGGADWVSIALRPNQNFIRLNRVIGSSVTTGGLGEIAVNEETVATLFIERVSAQEFKLGYTTISNQVVTLTSIQVPLGSQLGQAVGFYADLRSNSSVLGGLDNLAIYSVPDPADRGTVIMLSSFGLWKIIICGGFILPLRRKRERRSA